MDFDKIIITNLPAFYKINLFNRISESLNILVVFTGFDAEIRNMDFFSGDIKFRYQYLKSGSISYKVWQIVEILSGNKYRKLIIGGWDEVVLWAAAFVSPTHKNEMILESSYLESKTEGPKKMIKKLFLKRISTVYASGSPQFKLLDKLEYKGNKVQTGGVGIFNLRPQKAYIEKKIITKFLYVGRFSKEKNLRFVIDYFNSRPELTLSMVGYGPEEEGLKSIAAPNVVFYGEVLNSDIYKYYGQHDVLILASLNEVWGLVIEEALNNGLPVLVSKQVGSSELWNQLSVAELFDPFDQNSLNHAVNNIINPERYNFMSLQVSSLDFQKRAERQVHVYIN